MSGKAKSPTAAAALVSQLLGASTDVGVLTPIEMRIVRVACELLPTLLIQCRILPGSSTPLPVSVDVVTQATRLAVAAAIEMDEELRTLRSGLEKKRDGP